MASERQVQDKENETKEDSLGNADTKKASTHKSEDRPKKSDKSDKSQNSDSNADSETMQKLDLLSDSLQGDLSSIDPDTALTMISDLHGLVQKSKQPEAKELATGLKDLQKLLKQKEPTAHELGELISHLGEQTSDIAAEAEKELKTPLQHLGKQLIKVGRSLCKAEDQEYVEGLDSLVDILEQEPKKIDFKPAVGEIDRWYDLLHKSEDDSLKSIAGELKELKQILQGNKPKGADLSEKLIHLGEQTKEFSTNASRGFKGAIQKLGKALVKFGKSLA